PEPLSLLALDGDSARASAEDAGHPVDQSGGVRQVVRVITPEPAGGPGQDLRPDVLGARQEIIVADLVDAGGLRVPLVGRTRQRLLHKFVPDGGGAYDPGRVVAERRFIRIADPDGGGQRWREADRPVVAEGLGGPGLGGDVPARQRQVAVTAE